MFTLKPRRSTEQANADVVQTAAPVAAPEPLPARIEAPARTEQVVEPAQSEIFSSRDSINAQDEEGQQQAKVGSTSTPHASEVTARPKATTSKVPPQVSNFWEAVQGAGGTVDAGTGRRADVESETVHRPVVKSGNAIKYRFIGEILRDEGLVTDANIADALAEQSETYERIGEIFLRRGLVTDEQIKAAIEKQKPLRTLENILRMLGLKVNHIRSALMRVEGREEPIQQVMRDTGYLSEEEVAIALAALNGMQYYRQDRMDTAKFAAMISRGVAIEKYAGYAPVAILDDETLCVALEHVDFRNDAHNHFEQWANKIYLIASGNTLHKIFCNHFSKTEEILLNAIRSAETTIRKKQETNDQGFIRRLIGTILRHGCYSGASDIHMKESPYIATLSMRYDGVLKDVAVYDRELHQRITTQLRTDGVTSNVVGEGAIDAMREGTVNFENDKASYEMFRDIFDRYGFRLQLGITVGDRKTAVIRIIDSQGATADLDNLGFDPVTREIIDSCIHSSDGMILLVGPTGSGKTTTLYAAMEEIDPEEHSIQTIENPVEGPHGKWQQFQVSNRQNMSEGKEMAAIFKGQMRNDPDVILVGEIRDEDVADTAVQAAKTGHIVFSTLHVTRASAVLTRLLGLKVSRQDVADTLKLVIAQRLVRKLCSSCSIDDDRDSTKKRFERPLKEYLADVKPRFKMARDGGCKECRYTGYRGRAMVYEAIEVNGKLRKLIERGASTSEIEETAIRAGGSMFELGMRYVANGLTSIEELLRSVSDTTEG